MRRSITIPKTKENALSKAPHSPLKRKKKKQTIFLQSLREKMGIASLACSQTGISFSTYANWRLSDPQFETSVQEIEEAALDFVETRLFEKINQGDVRMIRFFLETRGKKRGYVTKSESAPKAFLPVILTPEEAMIKGDINSLDYSIED